LERRSRNETGLTHHFVETRRHPRFKLEVDIRVYPGNASVVLTVDISESGISAMLMVEVPIGEVVRLEVTLPWGAVDVHALVWHRNALRYGFQFLESSPQEVIGRACSQLAMEQSVRDAKLP
jgi:hypothetical protein